MRVFYFCKTRHAACFKELTFKAEATVLIANFLRLFITI
jgi:hypothetical protein